MNISRFAGPHAHPFLGIFPSLVQDPLRFLTQCQKFPDVAWLRYGIVADIFQRRWQSHGCLLNNPKDITHVLSSNYENYPKFAIPPSEAQVFQSGILHSQEPLHRQRRLLLQACFQSKHFGRFGKIIVEETVRQSEEISHGAVVNVSEFMTRLTLAIIGRVLFSKNISQVAPQLSQAITVIQHQIVLQYRYMTALFMPLWVPTARHRSYWNALTTLDQWISHEIMTRRRSHQDQQDVLAHLLEVQTEDGLNLNDNAIRDELMTLFLAGHETTANATAWLWYQLTQNSEIEGAVRDELSNVLHGRLPTTADMPQLPYCKSVFQEVLRLFPPAYMLHLRKALGADELPSGTNLTEGTELWISPYATQRHPQLFLNPGHFDPLRFQTQTGDKKPSPGYFPFGMGPRRCLGENFAMLEGILIMATLLSLMKIKSLPAQDIQPDPLFTLRMKQPFFVRVVK